MSAVAIVGLVALRGLPQWLLPPRCDTAPALAQLTESQKLQAQQQVQRHRLQGLVREKTRSHTLLPAKAAG